MQSQSSGSINYWPGFVDAFSNLVLALVFVIVILAMSLGMFSGLMAKMAIQRALVEQRLDESKKAQAAGARLWRPRRWRTGEASGGSGSPGCRRRRGCAGGATPAASVAVARTTGKRCGSHSGRAGARRRCPAGVYRGGRR